MHPTITTTFNIFLALSYTFLNTSFFCRLSHYPDLLNILTFPATCDFFRMFTIIDGLGNLSAACLFFLKSYIFMLTYIPTTYRISPKDLLSCYVPMHWFVEHKCIHPAAIFSISLNIDKHRTFFNLNSKCGCTLSCSILFLFSYYRSFLATYLSPVVGSNIVIPYGVPF